MRQGHHRRTRFPSDGHPKPTSPPVLRTAHSRGLVEVEGKAIWWQIFRPSQPATAVIAMFHGYGDHSDFIMFEKAHDLALAGGFTVIAFDQPGFGRSDGLWGFIPDWFAHVALCVSATKAILNSNLSPHETSLPVFAYGHSMGGGLVATTSVLQPNLFAGIVLSAPMCGLAKNLRRHWLIEAVFFALADYFPTLPITPVPELGDLCFKDPAYYQISKRVNHLNYPGRVRLGTAKSMLIAQQWIGAHSHELLTPFLILHGDSDFVTSSESSQLLHKSAGATDKTIQILPGYFHSIIGPGQPRAMSEHALGLIVNWVKART